jgi:monoamine oxidase
MSIAQWLDRQQVSGWLRKLIDVAYTTEMGLEIDHQSALNLLTFIGTDDPDAFRVFGASDERFHVRGGNDRIPHALAANKLDDAIEPGAVLEAVRARGDDLVLSFRRNGATRDVQAAHAILALPFTLLRKVAIDVPLPAHKRNAIDRLPYGTNAKLMIGYDRRAWRAQGANGASMSDLSYQTTWETTREQSGAHGRADQLHRRRAWRRPRARHAAHAGRCGDGGPRSRVPGSGRCAHATARSALPLAQPSVDLGSYACFGPGDWSTLRGAVGEPSGGCSSPASTAHSRRRASWKAVASRARLAAEAVLSKRSECALARRFPAFMERRIRAGMTLSVPPGIVLQCSVQTR